MIIITAKSHPVLIDTLREKGYEVLYEPDITYDELSRIVEKATGLVVTTRIKIDRAILDKAVSLRLTKGFAHCRYTDRSLEPQAVEQVRLALNLPMRRPLAEHLPAKLHPTVLQ